MSKPVQFIAYLCLLISFLILLHQYILYDVWFEIADIHHETFSIAFVSFGIGITLGLAARARKP
ncbi:MAG: hypothetical protein JSV51_08390 [Candidatus Bathyarchaeota archaeon]|nr:MAG: hypothetical protein JSV51_08390 [Candidatus Bathyarchaeota archaeon]